MAFYGRDVAIFVYIVVGVFWLSSSASYGTESDIYCLKTFMESLEDPTNNLASSWIFDDHTEGFICKFAGIVCWHPDESRVLNIRLSGMNLKGQFPRGLENCTSLTGLDLSYNKLFGPIPLNISKRIGYITYLDLSSNRFTGEIPVGLANVSFLNTFKLDNNQLTGPIPPQLGLLSRLTTFSVANNLLTGQIPVFINGGALSPANFSGNPNLCGVPLDPCRAP